MGNGFVPVDDPLMNRYVNISLQVEQVTNWTYTHIDIGLKKCNKNDFSRNKFTQRVYDDWWEIRENSWYTESSSVGDIESDKYETEEKQTHLPTFCFDNLQDIYLQNNYGVS